jgi:hypothetical protein
MGLNLLMSSSENDKSRRCISEPTIIPNQPNPGNFIINRHYCSNGHTVVLVTYPDAKSYEGRKIIVFIWASIEEIRSLKRLDPHFVKDINLSPFARFEPTDLGWKTACKLIDNI